MAQIVELSGNVRLANAPLNYTDIGPCGTNGRLWSIKNIEPYNLQVVYQEQCVTDVKKSKVHYRSIAPKSSIEIGCSRVGNDAYQFNTLWSLSNTDYIPRDIENVYQNLIILATPNGDRQVWNPNATRFVWLFTNRNGNKYNYTMGTVKDSYPNEPIVLLYNTGVVDGAQWA